jgi:hypothetical protein
MSYTLASLTQAVQDTLENDEPSLVANIPNFIRNTEERILQSVRLNAFRKNMQGVASNGNKYLSLPDDFLTPFSLSVVAGGAHVFLQQKDTSFIQSVNPDPTVVGVPRYYAQYDVDSFILAPTPAANYATELNYMYRPASLADGADDGTTWLSVNAPDTLLYGTLFEASIYQKDEETIANRYFTRFGQALERLRNLGEGLQTTEDYRVGQVRGPRR